MNREIWFRGKRTDNGEWVYGSPLFDWADCSLKCKNQHNGELYLFLGWNDACHEYEEYDVDPDTIGQYTGLTDKNGVRIFEMDIVDILCENEEIGVIEWDKNTARFIVSADGFYADFDNYYGNDLEVIDNIHDNPELLGGNDGKTDKNAKRW